MLHIRIWDPVSYWPLDPDPGSRIGLFRIPDLGSRIPNPYFLELSDKFLGKSSLKTGPIFFFSISKINNLKFCEICGYKKGRYKNKFFFTPLFFFWGFWIRDLESEMGKNQDPGSEIRNTGNKRGYLWVSFCGISFHTCEELIHQILKMF